MSLDTDGALLALANLLAHFQYLTTAQVLLILDSQTIINLCGASLHAGLPRYAIFFSHIAIQTCMGYAEIDGRIDGERRKYTKSH